MTADALAWLGSPTGSCSAGPAIARGHRRAGAARPITHQDRCRDPRAALCSITCPAPGEATRAAMKSGGAAGARRSSPSRARRVRGDPRRSGQSVVAAGPDQGGVHRHQDLVHHRVALEVPAAAIAQVLVERLRLGFDAGARRRGRRQASALPAAHGGGHPAVGRVDDQSDRVGTERHGCGTPVGIVDRSSAADASCRCCSRD